MSEFYATTNPDGTIEPHWVEGQREILCSAELIKQMIDNANRGILMELETHDAIRAHVEKLARLLQKEIDLYYEDDWTRASLTEEHIEIIRNTPLEGP